MKRIETPGSYGPWTASPSESGETIWIGNDSENAGCVPGYTDHPHNIANARLIAESPTMYDVLRAVDHTLSVHGKIDADTDLHARVRDAIFRVTGNKEGDESH